MIKITKNLKDEYANKLTASIFLTTHNMQVNSIQQQNA